MSEYNIIELYINSNIWFCQIKAERINNALERFTINKI